MRNYIFPRSIGLLNFGIKMPEDEIQQEPNLAVEQAFQLSQAAIRLDLARQDRDSEPARLLEALSSNLEIWMTLRYIVTRDDCQLPDDTRSNLIRLSRFIADRTFVNDGDVANSTLDALININLQIAEGLLEGVERPAD